ncbi:MAG: hypothetical protein ACRBFS_24410 [Aureispira sp.]
MACTKCSKSKKKKKSSIAGMDSLQLEMAVGAMAGGVAGGYIDYMIKNKKDASGNYIPVADPTSWRADPTKRSAAILGAGFATMLASTYVEDKKMAEGIQGVGQGIGVYGFYGLVRENVFKDATNGTYSISGPGTSMPYPMDTIAGYIPPASIATTYPADHMNHQHAQPQMAPYSAADVISTGY